MLIVVLHERYVLLFQETHELLFSDGVFLHGMDVGIAEEDRRSHAVLQHALHNGGGARRATGVKKNCGSFRPGSVRQKNAEVFVLRLMGRFHVKSRIQNQS